MALGKAVLPEITLTASPSTFRLSIPFSRPKEETPYKRQGWHFLALGQDLSKYNVSPITF